MRDPWMRGTAQHEDLCRSWNHPTRLALPGRILTDFEAYFITWYDVAS